MADAHEAARHDVEEQPPQEFINVQRHHLLTVVIRVVLPPKPDAAVALIDQPIIGEGDAVGIASEVGEHLLGAGEQRQSILPIVTEKRSSSVTRIIL